MTVRFLFFLGLFAVPLAAAPLKFSSGGTRAHLIELYSSEGCSSCPPAEQWLGDLRDAPGLWRDFVPVAFHVVYWDNLGWRDRFASKEFTARQYAYAAAWGGGSVYTPGVVVDGAEWKSGLSRRLVAPSTEMAGVLSVEYANGSCRVNFSATGDYEVHAAVLGAGITSSVRSGENEGRTLRHDFVALALVSTRLQAGGAELNLPLPVVAGVKRHALAVWITRRGELTPLQATGGWLD